MDAFEKISRLVARRDYSTKQIKEKLIRAGFSLPETDAAIARAKECGYIDDMRFTRMYVFSKFNQGQGILRIKQQLKTLGIEGEFIDAFYADASSSSGLDEYERALRFLELHPTQSKNIRDASFRKLVNKGFSIDVCSKAARSYAENHAYT
jgi:regulatory protein